MMSVSNVAEAAYKLLTMRNFSKSEYVRNTTSPSKSNVSKIESVVKKHSILPTDQVRVQSVLKQDVQMIAVDTPTLVFKKPRLRADEFELDTIEEVEPYIESDSNDTDISCRMKWKNSKARFPIVLSNNENKTFTQQDNLSSSSFHQPIWYKPFPTSHNVVKVREIICGQWFRMSVITD